MLTYPATNGYRADPIVLPTNGAQAPLDSVYTATDADQKNGLLSKYNATEREYFTPVCQVRTLEI